MSPDPSLPSYSGHAHGVAFTCAPARYAKGKCSLHITADKSDGWKGPADRLLDALNANWNRRSGYVIAPSRALLWRALFEAGWDAEMDWRHGHYATDKAPLLVAPDGRKIPLREAAKEMRP